MRHPALLPRCRQPLCRRGPLGCPWLGSPTAAGLVTALGCRPRGRARAAAAACPLGAPAAPHLLPPPCTMGGRWPPQSLCYPACALCRSLQASVGPPSRPIERQQPATMLQLGTAPAGRSAAFRSQRPDLRSGFHGTARLATAPASNGRTANRRVTTMAAKGVLSSRSSIVHWSDRGGALRATPPPGGGLWPGRLPIRGRARQPARAAIGRSDRQNQAGAGRGQGKPSTPRRSRSGCQGASRRAGAART